MRVGVGGRRVVGGDEVGCQECGSWSALFCVLCKMNRPMAGWGACQSLFPVDLCVRKALRLQPAPLQMTKMYNKGYWVSNLNTHYI